MKWDSCMFISSEFKLSSLGDFLFFSASFISPIVIISTSTFCVLQWFSIVPYNNVKTFLYLGQGLYYSLISLFMCCSSFSVFGFIVCMLDSKCDINCSKDFRCVFLISVLAVVLLLLYSICLSLVFVWRYFLHAKLFCCTINFISSSHFFLIFSFV